MAERATEVVVQIAGEDVPAGRLWSHRRRGTESQTFAYAPEYVSREGAYQLDPGFLRRWNDVAGSLAHRDGLPGRVQRRGGHEKDPSRERRVWSI